MKTPENPIMEYLQLYRSFSETGNPTLKTTLAVMKALGIDLTAKPHSEHVAV
jgi:DNA-binding phage protein